MLVHRDADQRHQAQPQLLRVELGAVTGDDAGLFQCPHPAQAGRRREADAVGEILVADPPILLQHGENLPIVAVYLNHIAHNHSFAQFSANFNRNHAIERKHLLRAIA
ncbi:hypothetical protein SDC9_156696 [bioreactor metagenome]|uniref:Uncharacterized protein n=1 Tax=bioreactor metagenome TaxID=1076179 RepID=A0A645F6X5_9ZZZZ